LVKKAMLGLGAVLVGETSSPTPWSQLKEVSGVRLEENPLMNVGVVGLQEPRISVTLYTSKTYLLSATQTPT